MTKVVIVCGIVALGIPLVLWNAFVLSALWGWFVVPLGVPGINMAHAMGLSLIVGALKGIRSQNFDDEGSAKRLGFWLLGTVLSLAMGYFIRQYI